MKRILRVLDFSDRIFYNKLLRLSVPIILQQGMNSLLVMIDNLMIGALGETEIAAVGLANQLYFLTYMFVLGIASGTGVFVAQLWGKGQREEIHRVHALGIVLAVVIVIAGTLVGSFLPAQFIGLYNKDAQVISVGTDYLRIICLGYIFSAVSQVYGAVLKNSNIVLLSFKASAVGIAVNTVFNYILIFGKLGAPALGVKGAAIATLIALACECAIVLIVTYRQKLPAALLPRHVFRGYCPGSHRPEGHRPEGHGSVGQRPLKGLVGAFARVTSPVMLNEIGWGVATSAYMMVYGTMGKQAVAAMQIFNPIDRIAMSVFIGIGTATGILCGNLIGEGRREEARVYARRCLALGVIIGVVMGALVAGLGPLLLNLYNVSGEVRAMAGGVIRTFGSVIWLYVIVFTGIVGVLRGGGDTLYASLAEVLPMWLVSIPLMFLLGTQLGAPLWLVYLGTASGDVAKAALLMHRFRSGKWMHDVTARLGEA